MDRPWHSIFIEILRIGGNPAKFNSIRIEIRKDDGKSTQTVTPLGRMNYVPEYKGIYRFQYKLLNDKAEVWLVVLSDTGEDAKRIFPGKHKYRFRTEDTNMAAAEANESSVQYVYHIGTVENVFSNVRSLKMATSKYNQTGKGNTLVGEHGQMINSKNTNSQIGLSPQAEEGFKKVAASVKKSKSAAAQKDLSSLKKEAKKKSPDKTKMNALWSGVVKAVPAVTVEVGKAAVDAITGLFT